MKHWFARTAWPLETMGQTKPFQLGRGGDKRPSGLSADRREAQRFGADPALSSAKPRVNTEKLDGNSSYTRAGQFVDSAGQKAARGGTAKLEAMVFVKAGSAGPPSLL
jgi:hypothetical protein